MNTVRMTPPQPELNPMGQSSPFHYLPWTNGLLAHGYAREVAAPTARRALNDQLRLARREGWTTFQTTVWGPVEGCHEVLCRHDAAEDQAAGARALLYNPECVGKLTYRGSEVGIRFSTPGFRACWLTDLRPPDVHVSPRGAGALWWQLVKEIMEGEGFLPTDIIRTWFYNDHILDWYDEFNEERSRFFEAEGIFQNCVPASTGVGAGNSSGSALQGDVLAIQPLDREVSMMAVPSPLQCPALDYQSSFSRAVEIGVSEGALLLISGTASIAPDGRSTYPDDPKMQVEMTLDVIEAILRSRDMGWADVYRGTAFYTTPEAIEVMDEAIRRRGGDPACLLPAFCDICRGDLLFELEVDSWSGSV
jgi:enamine deaminase RidA (YjgF/YER057c/UK114 family)